MFEINEAKFDCKNQDSYCGWDYLVHNRKEAWDEHPIHDENADLLDLVVLFLRMVDAVEM